MNMKKILAITALAIALTTSTESQAQKHRPTAQQEVVDSTSKNSIEAYSDTTGGAMAPIVEDRTPPDDNSYGTGVNDVRKLKQVMDELDNNDIAVGLFVLGVLFIIFVLAPLTILFALFYFINKNRKQKLKLAQMAMQQGQPIPEQLLTGQNGALDGDDEYQKGLRQCFVGVGLMIFLGYTAGNVGFGVGALVFCIGLGKVVAGFSAQKKQNKDNLTPNNYD